MKTRIVLAALAVILLAGCRTSGGASAVQTSNGGAASGGLSTIFNF